MENFVLFLQANWKTILIVCFGVAELCLLIFRKRIKVDSVREKILEYLPLCISIVEKSPVVGSEIKKSACIDLLKSFVHFSSDYDSFVSDSIERILSTPEKKGK